MKDFQATTHKCGEDLATTLGDWRLVSWHIEQHKGPRRPDEPVTDDDEPFVVACWERGS